jgi:hypothetical protein
LPMINAKPFSEAEARAIVDEALAVNPIFGCDRLAKFLGLSYQQRTLLGIKTIGACDLSRAQRRKQRRHKDRMAKWRKRRSAGMRLQSECLSATQPWKELGMSRASWYRRNKPGNGSETTLSAISLIGIEDRPVSPERRVGPSERGFASKKARGLPSSQTATTMAADAYAPLPLELRLLALGLVETDWPENLARVA